MAEVERKTSKEEILAAQIEAVQNFGPEQILSPEKREQIVEAVTNGLDLIANTVKQQAEEEALSLDEIALRMEWRIDNFTRTALTTPPLPPQAFEMEESTLEAEVADEQNWWEVLAEEQKDALFQILKEDFGIDKSRERKPIKFLFGRSTGFIIRSERTITVPAAEGWPENKFQPALVFDPTGEPYRLACYVIG